jgi:protein TonB
VVQAKKLNQDENKRQRVVQTARGEKQKDAPADAFLGQQNQTFDQQTVSRNRMSRLGSENRKSHSHSPRAHERSAEKRGDKALSQFGIPILPDGTQFFSKSTRSDAPEWVTPGMRPEDYIDGLKESDRTALNTREFVFYSYFQRIRERLDRAWIPILRQKLIAYYRSGRHLASDRDHTTRVVVVLNEKGEIIRIEMASESGTKVLDDAAVGAFNKAGPFPNPPKGIVDRNREVKIPWDFVLKT